MKKMLKLFWRDESGAALVEYGVALMVVILAGTGGLLLVAENTESQFNAAGDATGEVVTQSGGTAATAP